MPKSLYLKAMENTLEIAEKCGDFRITKREIKLPLIKGLEGKNPAKYLKDLCYKATEKIPSWDNEYVLRLKEELALINSKKFSAYFNCMGAGKMV